MANPAPPGRPEGPPPQRPAEEAQPPGAGDPSMEDILASIRRILNEDEPAGSAPPPPPPAAGDEPLDLTRDMLVAGPSAPAKPSAKPAPPPQPQAPEAAAPAGGPPAAGAVPDTGPDQPAPAVDALLAPAAAAAASASLGQLLRTVAAERGSAVARSGGPTIEDVVREELRPLLKEWLDRHLPAIVERLVRAEIERVVGRALS